MIANKKKTVGKMKGSGITAKRVKELCTDWSPIFEADNSMKAELGRDHPDDFEWVAFVPLKWAEEVLKATGKRIVIPELEWDADVLRKAKKPEPDSPEDFAQKMTAAGVKARLAIEKGDAAKAAYHAFNLGELVAAVRIKEIWERPALVGEKRLEDVRRYSERGVEARRKASAPIRAAWLKAGKTLRLKHRDWSTRGIAAEVCKQFKLPKRSLQNVHKFLLKNSV